MFKKIKLWESKLEYVKQVLEDIKSFDTSWHDFDQKVRYQEMLERQERKVKEYQELVDYLKGEDK